MVAEAEAAERAKEAAKLEKAAAKPVRTQIASGTGGGRTMAMRTYHVAQVENMKQAARLISQDAASDWLFLMPNLMVTDASVTGLPTNAISESFDLTALRRQ